MALEFNHNVLDRFLKYVQIDTQSDPTSTTAPTTEKQKDLSRELVKDLKAIGIEDAEMDDFGYVYGTVPATTDKNVPTICFCSHVDTAPDASGTNVKPIVHRNYDGSDIVLPDDEAMVLSTSKMKYLKEKVGDDIITASGKTLLGADDKAGVAIIMALAEHLIKNPQIKHGKIRILFTPDEEVGRGVDNVDMKKLGADFGYTLDGGEAGTMEDETFSADGVKITFKGVIIHPGYAKGKLENALKMVGDLLSLLPKYRLSPETTNGRNGFVHPTSIGGISEEAFATFIVRDFTTAKLEEHENELRKLCDIVLKNYPNSTYEFEVKEQYRNMKVILDKHPNVAGFAEKAIQRTGYEVVKHPIRGGTDGSRLSFMGLPCPNVFTGMQQIHSKLEWVSLQDMEKAVETLTHLVMIWEEES